MRSEIAAHPVPATDAHPDVAPMGWACQTRLPLMETYFNPGCPDCLSAAIGYLDAGQTAVRGFGASGPEGTLEEFVEWARKSQA